MNLCKKPIATEMVVIVKQQQKQQQQRNKHDFNTISGQQLVVFPFIIYTTKKGRDFVK